MGFKAMKMMKSTEPSVDEVGKGMKKGGKTKKMAMGGAMPAPMGKTMGPTPQIMGGSSNKMGPDSMKTGVPSNPANMSIAKPPGLTGAGVTKFTGPPSIKTAKNFEGLTPGGRPIVNTNNPAVQKFTGPMSTGPRFDKPPKPLTTPTSNPNVLKFNGPMVQSRLKKGGEVEGKAMHAKEERQIKGIKKELMSHEGKPASKAHKGLATGGVAKYATGGVVQKYATGGVVQKFADGGFAKMACKDGGGFKAMKKGNC